MNFVRVYRVVEVIKEETKTTWGEKVIKTRWLYNKEEAQKKLDEFQEKDPYGNYKVERQVINVD